ncbi:MAG: EAL domain-containing protein, partial [Xanthobacteraceae bacterium]
SLEASDGVVFTEQEVNSPKSGAMRIQATSRIVLRDSSGEAKYLIVVIDDITERRKIDQRIAFLAHHDALTGLANRAALTQKIEEAAARQRRRGEPFSVLLLDLDRFKQVNDTLGHPAGDTLLTEVAARLNEIVRETDVLARLGGDEFAIVQAGETNPREAASGLANRIIEALSKPFDIEGGAINIGASIGIALAPEHDTSSDNLLKMADLALYRAKSGGGSGYRFFDPEMSELASARHETEVELRRAIQHNELELHYQPIIDTKTRRICGAEALVRWRHPTKGLIFPDKFIPLAEETGLITQIGEWVLNAACAEAVKWPADIKVAVNLSLVQFRKADLSGTVMRSLAASGLPPERLELEITETALIESAAECLPALRHFKNNGITIVLDDFGTGYSSLSQLAMFPFDKIKIDKSFTQNLTKRSECAAIISATLTLAQNLNIATTAEGVETVDQYRILRLAGVTSLQGYLFKRPGPASEIDFDQVYDGGGKIEAAA